MARECICVMAAISREKKKLFFAHLPIQSHFICTFITYPYMYVSMAHLMYMQNTQYIYTNCCQVRSNDKTQLRKYLISI